MNPKDLLRLAEEAVQNRMEMYGPPESRHVVTARLWSAFLGMPITAQDVCFLNLLQKISRLQEGMQSDSLVDIVGYVLNLAALRQNPCPPASPPTTSRPTRVPYPAPLIDDSEGV